MSHIYGEKWPQAGERHDGKMAAMAQVIEKSKEAGLYLAAIVRSGALLRHQQQL